MKTQCGVLMRILGSIFMLLCFLAPGMLSAAESVCAVVKIEIKQELTLERQAFEAVMKINNGLEDSSLEDVNITVAFQDEQGQSVLASSDPNAVDAPGQNVKFFLAQPTLTNINDVSGFGVVAPATTAEVSWTIIPTVDAGGTLPNGTLYLVGATLTYNLRGEQQETVVTPDSIYVKPLPVLAMDYFLPRDVYADDPFTATIEPSEPFSLGVRVKNNGAATATDVKIDSAQPKIVENEQGLLIDFSLIGSTVNDKPYANTLLLNLGDIAPNSASSGRWSMLTTLAGRFTEFTATIAHADELGGELTSLIPAEAVKTRQLLRDVLVDLPGRDGVRDFLAYDVFDAQAGQLYVFESTGVDTSVTDHSGVATLTPNGSSGGFNYYTLGMPQTVGFGYARLADPYGGAQPIAQAIRSDGKPIPSNNVWRSKKFDSDTLTWSHYINLFDVDSTGSYTIAFSSAAQPPTLTVPSPLNATEETPFSVTVTANDPNGTTPVLGAENLPAGAVFIDNNDGTGVMSWTPTIGQAASYDVIFVASDGVASTRQAASISVASAAFTDSDNDGMDDAWEIDKFGDLSRDGTGDFDGDGISDLDEYLQGTDPLVADNVAPAASGQTLTADVDVPINGVLNAFDADGDALTYSIVANGTLGSTVITNAATGEFTYTPNVGATGADSFTFVANDGLLSSNVATVNISIEQNTAPVAADVTIITNMDQPVSGVLTASDAEGDALMYSVATGANLGTVVINDSSTGDFTYTPNAGASGSDSFTFIANDGSADSNTATVTVTINSSRIGYLEYDHTRTFGGTSRDYGQGVTTDADGNIYVVGYFSATANFDIGGAGDYISSAGNADAYISRINADGTYGWTRTLSGTNNVYGVGVATDSQGGVYIVGKYSGTANFDAQGAGDSRTAVGSNNGFISKFTTSGSYVDTRVFSGGTVNVSAVSVSGTTVYVGANYNGSIDFNPAGGGDVLSSQGNDVSVTKLNTDMSYGWTRLLGGANHDYGGYLTTDSTGNIYVAGHFTSATDLIVDGVGQSYTTTDGSSAFVLMLNADGSYAWSRLMGGTPSDIAVNADGDVYTTGTFSGTVNFDPLGAGESKISDSTDVFFTRLSSIGDYVVTQTFGGSYYQYAYAIAVDGNKVVIGGSYYPALDLGGGNTYSSNGGYDAFMVGYEDGNHSWTHVAGNYDRDYLRDVTISSQGDVFGVGDFGDSTYGYYNRTVDFDPSVDSTDNHTPIKFNDVFLTKYRFIADSDQDGVPDAVDAFPFDPMESVDTDGDGIGDNADEDADNDGLPNNWETQYGLDPLNAADAINDGDADGLDNLNEFTNSTDPTLQDTDGDGIYDGFEVQYGLNPLSAADAALDGDSDSLTNLQEFDAGTNPSLEDSDGDGMADGWELQYGLNPRDASDAALDLDGDGVTNVDEFLAGSDPSVGTVLPDVCPVDCAYSTIQAAVDAAGASDVITVGSGTYTEAIVVDKQMTLTSVAGPHNTVIDATGLGLPVFTLNQRATVDGFTVTGGQSTSGAAFNVSANGAIIRNNIVKDNHASSNGGGVYVPNYGYLLVEDNVFEGNTAVGYGGAILLSAYETQTVQRNIFRDNSAGNGGAIVGVPYGSDTVKNNVFIDNTNTLYFMNYATTKVINNTIVGSTGYAAKKGQYGSMYMTNGILWNNENNLMGWGWTSQNSLEDVDPLFIDAFYGDLHLNPGSPAIDFGIDGSAYGVTDDFDLVARPQDGDGLGAGGTGDGSDYDAGAFEFH